MTIHELQKTALELNYAIETEAAWLTISHGADPLLEEYRSCNLKRLIHKSMFLMQHWDTMEYCYYYHY